MKTKPTHLLPYLTLAISLLILTACGGGSSKTTNTPPIKLIATAVTAALTAACPNGGITVESGIDTNVNKILDPTEVTSTQYVCNSKTGNNGLTTLVLVASEAAGANCAASGKKISAGQDSNGNDILDANEITTNAYVCNESNSSSSGNELNSLISIVPEPAGGVCKYGDNKVSNGVDTNSNSKLDTSEITRSNYLCNDAPIWVNVTGISAQALANTGYLANNDLAQVIITLPAAPVLDDIVKVSGLGAGGWKIAQNAGQSIISNTNLLPPYLIARDSRRYWYSVASSSDGTKLIATTNGNTGQIYTSADSGVTWIPRGFAGNWGAVASSTDGTKLVTAIYGGQIYTSTDSGVSWLAHDSPGFWAGIASSSDGTKLVATTVGIGGGHIFTSTDSGATWTARDSARNWSAVTSSADGNKLVATVNGGQLYTSSDSGVTWTPRATTSLWLGVASSVDGNNLVASGYGSLYTSTDAGVTWTPRGDATKNWNSVASSADGSKLVAVVLTGQFYTSSDFGVTWTAHDSAKFWSGVASSSDGSKLVAIEYYDGYIYTTNPIVTAVRKTTVGIAGALSGGQYDAVDLQYVGNNTFVVRGYVGNLAGQ
jgi:hypothetical protein